MEGIELGYQDSPKFNGGEGIPMELCNYMAYDMGSDSQSAKLVPRNTYRKTEETGCSPTRAVNILKSGRV